MRIRAGPSDQVSKRNQQADKCNADDDGLLDTIVGSAGELRGMDLAAAGQVTGLVQPAIGTVTSGVEKMTCALVDCVPVRSK